MRQPGIIDQIAAWALNICVVGVLLPSSRQGTALSLCFLIIAVLCAGGIGLSMRVHRGRLSYEQDERRRFVLSWMPMWLLPLGGGLIYVLWQLLDALPYHRLRMLEAFYAALVELWTVR